VFGIRRAAFVDNRASPVAAIPIDPSLVTSSEDE
jgi:hypothetical protein